MTAEGAWAGGDEEGTEATPPGRAAGDGNAPLADLSDAALMGRMRLGEDAAVREFFARFEPRLLEAAPLYRARGDVGALVLDVLADVAQAIVDHRVRRDGPLAGYVVNAFRNRVNLERRRLARREAMQRDAAIELAGVGESAVASASSAYAVRGTRAPREPDDGGEMETEDDPLVRALWRQLDAIMTPEEQRIVGWLAERVAQREIAEWIGATHNATRVRIHRLRARLDRVARTWIATLDVRDRERLERRFLSGARLQLVRRPLEGGDDATAHGGAGSGRESSAGTTRTDGGPDDETE